MKIYYVLNFVLKLILAMFMVTYYHGVHGYDPNPLQDICVATDYPKNMVFVNGKFCKDPKNVTVDDFFFSGFDIPTDTNNIWGYNATTIGVSTIPGLNTLGVAIARLDYAPKGVNFPYTDLNAGEVIVVLQGSLYVGFVSSNEDGNRLFAKTLNEGDVFAFPKGTVIFQYNFRNTSAVALLAWGSQYEGYVNLPNTLFGSSPRIDSDILAKSFQLDESVIDYLQNVDWPQV